MRTLESLKLPKYVMEAVVEFDRRVQHAFDVRQVIIFGSVARGEAGPESDLDLFVMMKEPYTPAKREMISDIAFEVNLHYGSNISTLVADSDTWDSGLLSIAPIHTAVERDGVSV